MRGGLSIAVVGLALWATPASLAQRGGIEFHGTPASVTSPGVDGRPRGIPASVTDPTLVFRSSVASARRHREHNRDVRPVYVVPYYGYYVPADDSGQYAQQQTPQEPATEGKEAGPKEEATSTQDEDSRYGEHYFDGREKRKSAQDDQLEATASAAPPAKIVDDSPMTTLVYRDGHKSEVRNYAIVGSNLIDLTRTPVLKKIPLDSLDLVATHKENEDHGVDFHTP